MMYKYEIKHMPVGELGNSIHELISERYIDAGLNEHMTRIEHFYAVQDTRLNTDVLEGYIYAGERLIGIMSIGQNSDLHYGEVAVPYVFYVLKGFRCPEVARYMASIRREIVEGMGLDYYIHPSFKNDVLTYRKRGI